MFSFYVGNNARPEKSQTTIHMKFSSISKKVLIFNLLSLRFYIMSKKLACTRYLWLVSEPPTFILSR